VNGPEDNTVKGEAGYQVLKLSDGAH